MASPEKLAHGYFFAKNYIIKKGYGHEIDWQDDIAYAQLTEQKFLEEFAWVVIASGMNDKVVRKIFPQIKQVMFNFKSGRLINHNNEACLNKALLILNHPGKINAILTVCSYINTYSFESLKSQIREKGVDFIQTFPYMGKATSFHLAKNLGLDVAKPDRHLVRISEIAGYLDVNRFCQDLSLQINEKVSLIDLVLWRYATLDKNYMKNISWFINK